MPKKVLIALPPLFLQEVDRIAEVEHRTRSDLIREALRRYLQNFNRGRITAEDDIDAELRELVFKRK